MVMIGIFVFLSLVVSSTTQAATAEQPPPVALTILHTADGQGEISPCG